MLTVLTVTQNRSKRVLKRLWSRIKPNSPKAKVLSKAGVLLLQITVTQENRCKQIPVKKIKKMLGRGTREVLCRQDLSLPIDCGFHRYTSSLFMRRLCENGVLVALKEANCIPSSINVSLYDPKAIHSDMAEYLLRHCGSLRIITNHTDFYHRESDRLMEEYGASILVGDQMDWLSTCHVLVAPDKIRKRLQISPSTIVFTGEKPAVDIRGELYYRYKASLPEKYEELLPKELEPEYFMSALYELEKIHELGCLVPEYFVSNESCVSLEEISKHIKKSVMRTF